jgi:hypothetical protein
MSCTVICDGACEGCAGTSESVPLCLWCMHVLVRICLLIDCKFFNSAISHRSQLTHGHLNNESVSTLCYMRTNCRLSL